jgi:hypothetical protein
MLASGAFFATVSMPTKAASAACSFFTWLFFLVAFTYFVAKYYNSDIANNLRDLGADVAFGPGFGVTVTACWLAFLGIGIPFAVAEKGEA